MINLWTIQTEIFAVLDGAPQTYRVYDAVPQGVLKPYIVIGEVTDQPDEEIGIITSDATLTIHTWSATAGKKQTHDMLAFIRDRVDGTPLPGTWSLTEDFVEIMEDPASTATARLYHGIARYRVRADDGFSFPDLGQFDVGQFA